MTTKQLIATAGILSMLVLEGCNTTKPSRASESLVPTAGKTTVISRTVGDTSYQLEHPAASINLSNIIVNGQAGRRIQGNPDDASIEVEFDYFVSHPKSGNIVQLVLGIGTYAETFDLVFQGIPGPKGKSGHYKGTLAVPREVRESVKYRGGTRFGAILYFTLCYNKDQAFQYIKNGTYDCLQFQVAQIKYK